MCIPPLHASGTLCCIEVEEHGNIGAALPMQSTPCLRIDERQFNFVGELSVLVDYEVISKYIYILKHEEQYKKNPFLIQACSSFFKRIINQTKQTWIFFQIANSFLK